MREQPSDIQTDIQTKPNYNIDNAKANVEIFENKDSGINS